MREQDTVRAPGLGQVGVEEGQGGKDPEVGLSGGQRACAAGLLAGPRSLGSSWPVSREIEVQRGQGQALSHTAGG